MQYTSQLTTPNLKPGGGRIASPKLRELQEQCEDFTGLEEGTNRYDLLLLVKRAGKAAGFSPRMIALLDYYMAFTRDIDWEEGARPIVYKSLSSTALDMGVSERQIQALEKQLFEIGALTWHDSGNHRRYGQRCQETGRILYAFGVDLTPLAYLRSELQAKLHEKQLYDQAWKETKRQISYYRRQIRSVLLEAEDRAGQGSNNLVLSEDEILKFNAQYDAISYQIRTALDLNHLRTLLEKHKALFSVVESKIVLNNNQCNKGSNESKITQKDSSMSAENNIDYKYTTQKQSNKLDTCRDTSQNFQKNVAERSKENIKHPEENQSGKSRAGEFNPEKENPVYQTGLQHITLKQLLNVSSERFKEQLPIEARPMNHGDFVEAAFKLKDRLGISQSSWGQGCVTLGRVGAAVCVILTDQANLREDNRVMKPAAYFNAMITRAKSGDLKLHQSVMGHLKREFGADGDLQQNTKAAL